MEGLLQICLCKTGPVLLTLNHLFSISIEGKLVKNTARWEENTQDEKGVKHG